MSREVLKAVKDWCMGKFQAKGDYLTGVPEEYVTTQQLENFHPGGIRLGKDEEGNCGYYKYDEAAGADTFIPFSMSSGEGYSGIDILSDTYTSTTSGVPYGNFHVNGVNKKYKKVLFLCLYTRGNLLKNYLDKMTITINSANTYNFEETWSKDNSQENVFCYYKMFLCSNETNESDVIHLNYSVYLKQSDSTAKHLHSLVFGIY